MTAESVDADTAFGMVMETTKGLKGGHPDVLPRRIKNRGCFSRGLLVRGADPLKAREPFGKRGHDMV